MRQSQEVIIESGCGLMNTEEALGGGQVETEFPLGEELKKVFAQLID